MTSPSAFLYRYTPGSVGIVRILACRSMARGISNSNWIGRLRVVLQKGQMPLYCAARAAFSRTFSMAALVALLSAVSSPSLAQSITPAPQNQPVISKSPQGQKDEAARAAARSPAHHLDRKSVV